MPPHESKGVFMMRKLLFLLTALALTSSAALALPKGVTLNRQDRTVTIDHGTMSFVRPAMHVPKGSKLIFSNIGYDYPKGLYFCCYGIDIAGPDSGLGFQDWDGIAFTPSKSGTVTEIEAGMGYLEGDQTINFGIWS